MLLHTVDAFKNWRQKGFTSASKIPPSVLQTGQPAKHRGRALQHRRATNSALVTNTSAAAAIPPRHHSCYNDVNAIPPTATTAVLFPSATEQVHNFQDLRCPEILFSPDQKLESAIEGGWCSESRNEAGKRRTNYRRFQCTRTRKFNAKPGLTTN